MGSFFIIFAVLVGLGVAVTGATLGIIKVLASQANKSVGKERETIRQEIERYDETLASGLRYLETLTPLSELTALEAQFDDIFKLLAAEEAKVKALEKTLAEQQTKVDRQEARHSEIKKGREECDRVAEDLRQNKDRLIADNSRLEKELQQTEGQLKTFVTAASAADRPSLSEIQEMVDKTREQIKEISEVYTQACNRFLGLETQYCELEKEYRKLVDKELSGEEA